MSEMIRPLGMELRLVAVASGWRKGGGVVSWVG